MNESMRMDGDKIFKLFNYAILSIFALACSFPIVHIVAVSLSSSRAVTEGRVSIFPVEFSLQSFELLLKGTPVVNAFKNSLVITLVGVVLSMTATIIAAYPLSKKYFYARRQFTLILVFTMLFSGGIIPTYLVIKSLGLIDSYAALWLRSLVSAYNLLILKSFFENIPGEIEESCRIDGCGELRLLIQIYLPLSTSVLATLALFYGVTYWNMFMNVILYITQTSKYNLAVLIQQMIRSQILIDPEFIQTEDIVQSTPAGIRAAGIMVMVIPMLVIYPFLQKYFVKGVMLGSIKG